MFVRLDNLGGSCVGNNPLDEVRYYTRRFGSWLLLSTSRLAAFISYQNIDIFQHWLLLNETDNFKNIV
jgi:hypothetical protein